MGPRVMRRLPKYVHGFIDRHGKPRFYFRRPGFETRALNGLPYSAEFMSDYEAALAGQPLPVGANKARPGTMRTLALSYFASTEFRTLRESTREPIAERSSGCARSMATSAWQTCGASTS
jgi:hypothetical protein